MVPAYATFAATTLDSKAEANVEKKKKTLKIQTDEEGKPIVQEMNVLKPLFNVGQNIFQSIVKSSVKKLPNKGTGLQMFNTLKNMEGVKPSEMKWIGLDNFLTNNKTVTKQEIENFVKSNSIDVSEVKFAAAGKEKLMEFSDEIENMKISVVGIGAMGSVYAGLFHESGHEVWGIDIWK